MENISFKAYLKKRFQDKALLMIFITYIAFCLTSSVYFAINGSVRNSLLSFGYLGFAVLFVLAERLIHFRAGSIFAAVALFLAAGGILGTCYDLYTYVPFFDTLLHGLSGVLFACFGYILADAFFDETKGKKEFFGKVVFAVCLSLAIAVVWEIFEYACTAFLGFDMMEDTFVDSINSYLLAGSHAETVTLDGITKTVIYYGDGQSYTIDGYLELGLIDTLTDMIICTVGTVIFAAISVFGYFKFPKLNELLIPKTVPCAGKKQESDTEGKKENAAL